MPKNPQLAATILTKTYSLLKTTGVSVFTPHHSVKARFSSVFISIDVPPSSYNPHQDLLPPELSIFKTHHSSQAKVYLCLHLYCCASHHLKCPRQYSLKPAEVNILHPHPALIHFALQKHTFNFSCHIC